LASAPASRGDDTIARTTPTRNALPIIRMVESSISKV
jgi:hypothetical protein